MSVKTVKTECTNTIYVCDICGCEQEISMFTCPICGRDICGKHIVWFQTARHIYVCCECHEIGKELLIRENKFDKHAEMMNTVFVKAWVEVKKSVLNLRK